MMQMMVKWKVVGDMAQQVEALAPELEEPSLISRIHLT